MFHKLKSLWLAIQTALEVRKLRKAYPNVCPKCAIHVVALGVVLFGLTPKQAAAALMRDIFKSGVPLDKKIHPHVCM